MPEFSVLEQPLRLGKESRLFGVKIHEIHFWKWLFSLNLKIWKLNYSMTYEFASFFHGAILLVFIYWLVCLGSESEWPIKIHFTFWVWSKIMSALIFNKLLAWSNTRRHNLGVNDRIRFSFLQIQRKLSFLHFRKCILCCLLRKFWKKI